MNSNKDEVIVLVWCPVQAKEIRLRDSDRWREAFRTVDPKEMRLFNPNWVPLTFDP